MAPAKKGGSGNQCCGSASIIMPIWIQDPKNVFMVGDRAGVTVFLSISGRTDMVEKEEKKGRTFKRAFLEYSSRLFALKEAEQHAQPN